MQKMADGLLWTCAGEQERQSWLLCNALGAGRGGRCALALQAQQRPPGRGLVPWAGVAAPIALPDQAADADGTEAAEGRSGQLDGQAFCFLPQPCSTGARSPSPQPLHYPSCCLHMHGPCQPRLCNSKIN